MPWRRIYRQLSLAYGWTPSQIGQLTLAQIVVYMTDVPDIGETRQLDPVVAMAMAEDKSANKERWKRYVMALA